MQKIGKIGWLVFEIVNFFKIPNNVFYFEIGRAPTPPKRILLWIDARPPRTIIISTLEPIWVLPLPLGPSIDLNKSFAILENTFC